jgi:hypothetical protein
MFGGDRPCFRQGAIPVPDQNTGPPQIAASGSFWSNLRQNQSVGGAAWATRPQFPGPMPRSIRGSSVSTSRPAVITATLRRRTHSVNGRPAAFWGPHARDAGDMAATARLRGSTLASRSAAAAASAFHQKLTQTQPVDAWGRIAGMCHVWMAPAVQEKNRTFSRIVRVQPCIRPLNAAVVATASHQVRQTVPSRLNRRAGARLFSCTAHGGVDSFQKFQICAASCLCSLRTRGGLRMIPHFMYS